MNVAEAIYRAVANIGGYYEEGDHLAEGKYREFVATSPCPFPDDDGYPFDSAVIERNAFLTMPYKTFLRLEEDTQLGYLDGIADHLGGEKTSDVLKTLNSWIVDTATPTPKKSDKKAGDKWVSPGRLVCTWPDLDGTAQRVLFVMAAHGRDDGTNCFVGQETIAEYLGFKSAEPVRRAWRRLERLGAISMTAKATNKKPPTYRINRGSRVV